MKQYYFFFFALLIIACSPPVIVEKPQTKKDKLVEKYQPYDHDDLMLFGPNPTEKDFNFYTESALKAKDEAMDKSVNFSDSWTQQGPGNLGGRVNSIAIDPSNDDIIYAGFARGGLWKTTDAGGNWVSLWDNEVSQSVSAVAIHPTNSNIVYAGSGDINVSGNVYMGNGLFKSEDAGVTWTNIGLEETRIIGKIIINPENPDEMLVATMGNIRIGDENRGVYKTTDGGDTWENVLFVGINTGVHDIVFHPENPSTILAAAWTRLRTGKESIVADDKCKVYLSEDFGETWTLTDMQIPEVTGRPAITFKKDDSQVAYAMMMNSSSRYISLHRSVDAGKNWTMIDSTDENTPTMMGGFGWFFGRIGAMQDPTTGQDRMYLCGVDLWSFNEELDIWQLETPPWFEYVVHADKHAIVTDSQGNLLLGSDGGLYRKQWGSSEWEDIENIPNNMFYRVETSPHVTDEYYGGMQDNGSTGGNFNFMNQWPRLFGGDGFQMRFHPTKPDVTYFETQNGRIRYSDYYNFTLLDFGPLNGDRRNWDMQYILSPHNPDIVYTGTYRAASFDVTDPNNIIVDSLSESLTDPFEFISGYHTITALDESPIVEGLLYYGTADGNIWRRLDGAWEQISNGIEKHYVTSIKASPNDANTVYVTLSNYTADDQSPRIYKSEDNGDTWVSLHNGLPSGAVNDVIIYDDFEDKLMFVATNVGVYGSIDNGVSWDRVGVNMPLIPVRDMTFNVFENTLVAGTYGRSINTYDLTDVFLLVDPSSTVNTKYTNIKVYPNPFVNTINIESNVAIDRMELYSIDGGLLWERNYESSVDVSGLLSGTYILNLKNEEGEIVGMRKLIRE
jgi:photosystem II stability/assembly factor-like uncharacterized protein